MIPFFRKIRKKMADDNKPIKYMRYAIGEIVLVVIGILIALQINIWNEERKSKKTAKNYIEKIKNDIILDTLEINGWIVSSNAKMQEVESYYLFFKSRDWTIQQIIDSCVSTGYIRYIPKNSTYNDMLSSGNSTLLDENIRKELSELMQDQDYTRIVLSRIIDDMKVNLHNAESFLDLDGDSINFYPILGVEPTKKELVQGLKYYHNLLESFEEANGFINSSGNNIKRRSKRIIQMIDEQIKR